MCGRFVLIAPIHEIADTFTTVGLPNLAPRYNVAPTTPIVVIEGSQRKISLMRWGLIPSWVKDPAGFSLLINARLETVETKPSFRQAIRRRRCVVPANGFFEWRRSEAGKQAYYVTRSDQTLMGMAAIWATWCGPNGEEMDTVALLTTPANDDMRAIHHRMPVILKVEALDLWLDPAIEKVNALQPCIEDQQIELLKAVPIGPEVNAVRNDGPHLLKAISMDDVIPTGRAEPGLMVGQANEGDARDDKEEHSKAAQTKKAPSKKAHSKNVQSTDAHKGLGTQLKLL